MTTRDEALAPADRRMFWRWALDNARPYLGWGLVVLGAVAIFLGWYGVSGQAITAKQLPYLISGGATGIALVLIGGVFLATDNLRRHLGRLDGVERKVDELYALLVAEPAPPATTAESMVPVAATAGLVALPGATTFHRASCRLVAGKPDVATVDAAQIATRSLQPCPVCDPDVPPASE
jgi:hypothetical protein